MKVEFRLNAHAIAVGMVNTVPKLVTLLASGKMPAWMRTQMEELIRERLAEVWGQDNGVTDKDIIISKRAEIDQDIIDKAIEDIKSEMVSICKTRLNPWRV